MKKSYTKPYLLMHQFVFTECCLSVSGVGDDSIGGWKREWNIGGGGL